jgi:hypothetical protein
MIRAFPAQPVGAKAGSSENCYSKSLGRSKPITSAKIFEKGLDLIPAF